MNMETRTSYTFKFDGLSIAALTIHADEIGRYLVEMRALVAELERIVALSP